MHDPADPLHRFEQLCTRRRFREPDRSLAFLKEQFKRQVTRPFKQLESLVPIWQSLVPPELAQHTRLEGLHRGVLRVAVDDSAHLYEMDRLLRQGLERQIIRQHKGPAFRRIQLRVAVDSNKSKCKSAETNPRPLKTTRTSAPTRPSAP